MKGAEIMALSKEQLQKFKKSQTLAKIHFEKTGAKIAYPLNFELLEQYQEKEQKIELDQQTVEDIQKQVQQAIENGLNDVFK